MKRLFFGLNKMQGVNENIWANVLICFSFENGC